MPSWAVHTRSAGIGLWCGYPHWGFYYGSGWPYGGYYDYWSEPAAYYNLFYCNPTLYYSPTVYGSLAYASIAYAPTFFGTLDVHPGNELPEPQPEEVILSEPGPEAVRAGDQFILDAEAAFREGRYEDAANDIQHALVELPNDGHAMLLLSQSLFAVGDFQGAITTAYRGMSLLDTDQWGFVVENFAQYYGNDGYVAQMRKLDEYIKENPKAAYAYALRGYHFGYLGYQPQARNDLAKAIELESRDQFAAKLLARFGGTKKPPEPLPPAEEKTP